MKFKLTSGYGELSPVRGMIPHTGIDLNVPENTVLRSISDGVVEKVFDGTGSAWSLGNGVKIRLPDGKEAIYGHMNEVQVRAGERLREGEVLGLSGSTGNSTGPHLHFGLKDANGHFTDPTYLAEKVANHTGTDYTGPLLHLGSSTGLIPQLMGWSGDAIKENAREITLDVLSGVGEALMDIIAGATLVGSGICVLLKVAGWKDGGRWAGVLIVVNILLKFFLGGI